MPWTYSDFPVSWKNFEPLVKNKAVDIANDLLEKGYDENRALAIATSQAQKWGDKREIPLKKVGAQESSTIDTDPLGDGDEEEHKIHILPDGDGDGWIAKKDDSAIISEGVNQSEVLQAARKKARREQTDILIHDEHGNPVEKEDFGE